MSCVGLQEMSKLSKSDSQDMNELYELTMDIILILGAKKATSDCRIERRKHKIRRQDITIHCTLCL